MTKIENKRCPKCEETKAVTEFYPSKASKDRLQAYCKGCNSAIRRKANSTFEGKCKQALAAAKYNAKKNGVESALTLPEVRAILSCEKCVYCNKSLEQSEKSIDHLHPMNEGGANTFDNVVLACLPCNKAKNSKPPYDFIMQRADKDATTHLLATLATRFDETPYEALKRLERQHSAHIEKQFRERHAQ